MTRRLVGVSLAKVPTRLGNLAKTDQARTRPTRATKATGDSDKCLKNGE